MPISGPQVAEESEHGAREIARLRESNRKSRHQLKTSGVVGGPIAVQSTCGYDYVANYHIRPIPQKLTRPKWARTDLLQLREPHRFGIVKIFAGGRITAFSGDLGVSSLNVSHVGWPGENGYKPSASSVRTVLDKWSKYVDRVSNTIRDIAKDDRVFAKVAKRYPIAQPKAKDAALWLNQRVLQLIETFAMDRYEADLDGVCPITFNGVFMPEISRTLCNLFNIPEGAKSKFEDDLRKDLAEAAGRGSISGIWGRLIFAKGELALEIDVRRPVSRLKYEPHLADNWRPAEW